MQMHVKLRNIACNIKNSDKSFLQFGTSQNQFSNITKSKHNYHTIFPLCIMKLVDLKLQEPDKRHANLDSSSNFIQSLRNISATIRDPRKPAEALGTSAALRGQQKISTKKKTQLPSTHSRS